MRMTGQDELSAVKKFGLLTALYMAQGLPFGFFVQALPVLLREQGLSLPAIGLTSLLALPWALKFLWAPWADRDGARRRVILGLQASSAVLMVAVSALDPSTMMWWLLGAVLLTNFLAATQDIATDGLAVKLLSFDQRGIGNGIQVGAYRVGMILGGGVLLVLFDALGWMATFIMLALMIALTMVPLLMCVRVEEDVGGRDVDESDEHASFGQRMGQIVSFLRRPRMMWWLLVLFLYKFGESLAGGMLRPYLVDLEWGKDDIGWLLGGAGFTAGLLGALAGGLGAKHLERWRALIGFGVLQVVGNACYFALSMSDGFTGYVLMSVLVEHFTGGMATAILFTMMMDMCEERTAGTDYTIMASVVVLTVGLGQGVSGFIASEVGYAGVFGLAVVLGGVGVLMIWLWLRGMVFDVWQEKTSESTSGVDSLETIFQ